MPTYDGNAGSEMGVIIATPPMQISDLISLTGSVQYAPGSTASMPNQNVCTAITTSGACDLDASGVGFDGHVLLPVCTTASDLNCVAGLALGSSPSDLQAATFVRMVNGATVAADPAHGLPAGSTQGLWTDPVANAGGTNTYATYANLEVGYNQQTHKYSVGSFELQVFPYTEESGSYQPEAVNQVTLPNGRLAATNDTVVDGCAWTEAGTCGRIQDFAPNTEVSVSVRLTSAIGGWFQGRMQSPSISVTPYQGDNNLITVTAQSVGVPTLDVAVPTSQATSAMTAFYANVSGSGPITLNPSYPNAFDGINAFRDAAHNTSTGVINVWSYGSYAAASNSCMTSSTSILGVVTTNAMAFSPTTPTFQNGTLSYQVAGMHYMPDGTTPVAGTYDMVMADSVARCLYGFSNAPISGTVSVTQDAAGDQNTAVTSVSDNNGWIHLSAQNFQFSDPVITAKLTQAAAPTTTTTVPARRVSITCVNIKNAKVKKTVTAVKPVCPTGFRRA
jgi:hypothetical protein